MLNFWNICGVPFLYCFQSQYILHNQDDIDARGYPVGCASAVLVSTVYVCMYVYMYICISTGKTLLINNLILLLLDSSVGRILHLRHGQLTEGMYGGV